jgi:hypothetical protein
MVDNKRQGQGKHYRADGSVLSDGIWHDDGFDRAPVGGRVQRSQSLRNKLEPGSGSRRGMSQQSDSDDDFNFLNADNKQRGQTMRVNPS